MNPRQLRQSVSEYSLMIYDRGWVANHDGNVSLRAPGSDRFFITPTATSKRLCGPDTIVECDLAGKPIGRGKPPSEVALHVAAFKARPDVGAVVHAHPPHASAFALAQRDLGAIAMPEVVVSLGERVPLVKLLLPKDPETERAITLALQSADVALLAGNGAIAVGQDLEQAFLRMELLEHYARILGIAQGGAGAPAPLDAASVARLLEMRKQAGLLRVPPAPPKGTPAPAAPAAGGSVHDIVREEIQRVLSGVKH